MMACGDAGQSSGLKWGCCSLCEGELGPQSASNSVAWAEAYFRTKWYPDPSIRVPIIDMGRKVGRHIFNHKKFREATATNGKCYRKLPY